ncbi:MAG: AAA family ATPase [Crocinitomicaceae bacterium]|nr:AAA family ATPase [Crocinitomicaceae bacterium]
MNNTKTKRLRVFAGPNGSGKSTLAARLKTEINLGVFVNADEIEKDFRTTGKLSLYKFRFKSNTLELRNFLVSSTRIKEVLNSENPELLFHVRENHIYFKGEVNSYVAATLAAFIRESLLSKGRSFSFETVFSHESKLEIMKKAKELGYRVYFYFLTTDDPEINVDRVNLRVALKGHPVPEDKIVKRYYRSLDLMYDAVRISTRSYLFDNSGKFYEMVAQIDYGKHVEMLDYDNDIPNWFIKYFYEKANQKK